MDFMKVIQDRVSVRDYDPDKPLEKEVISKILEAGRIAPSAGNRQPWRFIVVTSEEMLEKVKKCYGGSWFQDAPAVLLVAGRREDAWTRSYDGYNSLETDLTIAMDHMILAAENEGVGTCWIAAFNPAVLFSEVPLREAETVFAITPLGYPRSGYEKRKRERKPLEEITEFL